MLNLELIGQHNLEQKIKIKIKNYSKILLKNILKKLVLGNKYNHIAYKDEFKFSL